ncbi:MAG: ATP-binding protein [Chloroflexi bacterium]|uniref:ATP-binding protein n=1 Tax=Candidatus Chlorohelix allophototropha TaxID=3003348 RepID=A0A8T7M8I8_9CHLR|nr:ATP-binding protein [Chloroflexota bacterium]WJW68410.1 ATP-binding protein [Chloroflexota bacterium L227-S17]
MSTDPLFNESLSLPSNAIEYYVSQYLVAAFPDKAMIQSDNPLFSLEKYEQAGLCSMTPKPNVLSQVITYWKGPSKRLADKDRSDWFNFSATFASSEPPREALTSRIKNGWFEISWEGYTLEVILMSWGEGFSRGYHYWILADFKEIAENFYVAVCEWNIEIRGELLVFDAGYWHKDEDLFRDIKGSTFDNLVLKGTLKQDIKEDLEHFFASRSTFEHYNIPWKRGILLVGPPGNGKTHAVKALINSLSKPCLYVKSIKTQRSDDEENISQVFDRARKTAPCVLVLEDLDSLVTAQNRSFFLNEMDGFAANAGIVTLATTNHPEKLDSSILDRPSRFDRKYHFDLPGESERHAYIELWNKQLQDELKLSDEAVNEIAAMTDGFSFAYLKELFLSSMMHWIAHPQPGAMQGVMVSQVSILCEQMVSVNVTPAPEDTRPNGQTFPLVWGHKPK